ncbi:winged helix-turn-helix domain-containing protein [Shewanella kaireitica]|uniref:winged helix-turn-helix domain-containing protein n=1 Tax=Shewanella kaireitica TaxID=212021 RepID=UPI00200D43CF|nr:winged helix-turn-helix domain-containing protein [Shewanella kaireitica]MCL1093842.1 winged helix-turn-helix domain-containing protein [Shewanella kaireitica]
MTDNLPDYFSINAWKIDCQRNLAWLGDEKVLVEPKAMMVLQYLASRPGETVSRQVLFEEFWPKQVVTEDALNRVMSSLRRLFKDNASNPEYIATIRKVGYKLVADVTVLNALTTEQQATLQNEPALIQATVANEERQVIGVMRWFAYLVIASVFIFGWRYLQHDKQQLAPANIQRLTHDKAINIMPAQSHQGDSFVYIAAKQGAVDQLMLREKTQTFPKRLGSTSSYSYPVFSPNDKRIAAIAQQPNQQFAIEIFTADNRQSQSVTPLEAISHGLSWHPTANMLAYSQPTSPNGNHSIQLWDQDKHQATTLTEAIPGAHDTKPIFSPSGDRLVFQRQIAFKEHAIFSSDLAGNSHKVSHYFSDILGVSWLNDEQLLVSLNKGLFTLSLSGEIAPWSSTEVVGAQDIDHHPQQASSLFSKRTRRHQNLIYDFTSQPSRFALTRSDADDYAANISPDTKHFAFVSDRSGQKSLWFRSSDQLTRIEGSEFSEIFDISWSADSSHFSAVVKDQGRYGLLIYAVASAKHQLHWQSTRAINGIGWKTAQTLLYSELNRDNKQIKWQLKSLDIASSDIINMAKFDVFQARLTPNKDKLLFIDANTRDLWSWDWHSTPQKLNSASRLDRNWDVNQQQILWIEQISGKTQLMRSNLDSAMITAEHAEALSPLYRPQATLHGLAATEVKQLQADIWQINQL